MISCTKTFREEKGKRVGLVGLMSNAKRYEALIDINDQEQESEQATAEEMK